MRKFFMTIVFMFMLASVSFGAEKKEYEYMEYYTDVVDPINYDGNHELVEEGTYYISRFESSDVNVYWHLDGNSIVCETYTHNDLGTAKCKYTITVIENGENTIYFLDFGDGNEQVYTS